jgi:hypothetical protein
MRAKLILITIHPFAILEGIIREIFRIWINARFIHAMKYSHRAWVRWWDANK